jgi:hypothetical protein
VDIAPLNPERWRELAPVFCDVFGDDTLPDESAKVVAAHDSEEIPAFIVVESLIFLAQVFAREDVRGTGLIDEVARYVEDRVPEGKTVVTIVQTEEGRRMAEKWGFTEIPGTLYRRDK